MASTIVPANILDGINTRESAVRTQFTNAATDITALQAPQYVTLATSGTLDNERVLTGTANQITITDGGAGSTVTLTISTNPVLPGTGSVTVPIGTTAQRPGSPVDGMLRYNTDTPGFEGRVNGAWLAIDTGGVTSVNSLTGALTFTTGTTGTDVNVDNTGTTITLNIPSASATNRGLVTTGTQTFAGNKSFSGDTQFTTASSVNIQGYIGYNYHTFVPLTGGTITLSGPGYLNYITPAGPLATLTAQLPDPAFVLTPSAAVVRLTTSQTITALTVTSLGTGATVLNAPTTLAAGGFADFLVESGDNRWSCIGKNVTGSSGVSSLNSLTGALSIATGSAGTDFAVSASGSTVTLDLPSASGANRGVVTTGAQTLAGAKTFSTAPILSSLTATRPLKLDGSNNVTASQITLSSSNDVTGTLAIGNGGTGSATQNFVDLTTGQTVAGVKTFSSDLNVTSTGAVLVSSGTTAQRPTATNGMIRYNTDTPALEARVNGAWVAISTSATGVSSVNTLTGALTFTTGTTGTDVNVDNTGTTITLNIPSASTANRGLVTTGTQTMTGAKTFNTKLTASSSFVTNAQFVHSGYGIQTPTTGQTVTLFLNGAVNILDPAGTLSSLTLNLQDATGFDGCVVYISTTQAITTVTMTASNSATIKNPLTTLAAGGTARYIWTAGSNIWYRLG